MQRQHNPKIWPMNPDSPPFSFLGEWLGTRLVNRDGVKAGLWTLDWTMDWTMDWNMDSILDSFSSF